MPFHFHFPMFDSVLDCVNSSGALRCRRPCIYAEPVTTRLSRMRPTTYHLFYYHYIPPSPSTKHRTVVQSGSLTDSPTDLATCISYHRHRAGKKKVSYNVRVSSVLTTVCSL